MKIGRAGFEDSEDSEDNEDNDGDSDDMLVSSLHELREKRIVP
jgi:hypothetical protein